MSSHNNNNNATRRPRPSHHHHTNFPPQSYADLTTSDMQLLAFLFSHPPTPSSSSSSAQAVAAYESHIRTLITTTLPPHLLAKIPLLNTGFCHLHRKLNGLVVESLVEVMFVGVGRRHDDEGKKDKKDKKDKCPGCVLARLVLSSSGYDSNNKQQEDWAKWGGRVIFSISKKKWKGSKRIRWMEEWFAAAVVSGCKEEEGYHHGRRGRRSDESLAKIVKPMWDVALELYRQGQQDHSSSSRRIGGERDYIDRYIEAAGDVDRARGEREACVATPPQSAATAAAADTYMDCIARDAGPSCWDESVVETPDARVLQTPRHTPPQASSIYSRMEDGEPFRQAEMPSCAPHEGLRLSRQSQHARRVLTPSSIYSREQDFDCYEEEDEDDWDYRGTAESQIIESYRR